MKKTDRKKSYRTQLNKQLTKKQVKIHDMILQSKWLNSTGQPCKIIQKKHLCFCGHQYGHHRLLSKKLVCDQPGCKCSQFEYVPNLFLNCICHHNVLKHSKDDRHCSHCTCCFGFTTDWHCICGQRYQQHTNTYEYTHPHHKKSNMNNNKSCITLPSITKNNPYNNLPQTQDRIVQNRSHVYKKHQKQNHSSTNYINCINNGNMGDDQPGQQDFYSVYLHNKLKEVNKRYFSKFNKKQQQFVVNTFQQDEKDGLNLYLKPHYYQKVPISKLIPNSELKY